MLTVDVAETVTVAENTTASVDTYVPGMVVYHRWRTPNGLFAQAVANWVSPLSACGTWQYNSRTSVETEVAAPGTLSDLHVLLTTAPGAGKSITFTLYKNGVATALACTISDTAVTASDTTDAISVSVGDLLSLSAVGTGSPASSSYVAGSLKFVGTSVGGHTIAGRPADNGTNAALTNNGACNPFFPGAGWFGGQAGVVAAAATLTSLRMVFSTSPGANVWTFAFRKNGVTQDGSGGTPDTRVVITGGVVGASAFSLSVAAGDTLDILATRVGSTTTIYAGYTIGAVASVAHHSTVNVQNSTFGAITARYTGVYGAQPEFAGSVEADSRRRDFNSWRWKYLYALPNGTIGGIGCTFTVRDNGVATAVTGVAFISSSVNAVDTTHDFAVTALDELTIQGVGASGVSSRAYAFGYVMDATPPVPPGGTETVTVTDAVALVMSIAEISVSCSATVTDDASRATAFLVDANEVVTAADVATRVANNPLAVTDAVTVSDWSSMPGYPATQTPRETVTVLDVVLTSIPVLARSVSDTVTVTEGPLNHNAFGIGPDATPLPAGNLSDYWTVGIV